jgi:hypothetical protein
VRLKPFKQPKLIVAIGVVVLRVGISLAGADRARTE